MTFLTLLFLFAISRIHAHDRPIIGIFTAPSLSEARATSDDNPAHNYLAASYVKWIEQAGGRVVPIPYKASTRELDYLFNSINGLLFPGGGVALDTNAEHIYNLALEANRKKDYFPVWGTCLGYEWILQIHDGAEVNETFDAENLPLTLDFTHSLSSSRIFANASRLHDPDGNNLMDVFKTQPISFNNHHLGMTPKLFSQYENLSKFFRVIAINEDRKGSPFIAIIEGIHYPFYAVQWHPEKNQFEWGIQNNSYFQDIPHQRSAIWASWYLADFFVNEARKNNHRFPTLEEEDAALIWNYKMHQGPDAAFVQVYDINYPASEFEPPLLPAPPTPVITSDAISASPTTKRPHFTPHYTHATAHQTRQPENIPQVEETSAINQNTETKPGLQGASIPITALLILPVIFIGVMLTKSRLHRRFSGNDYEKVSG
jgi:gamma-glutamyl hydrolase